MNISFVLPYWGECFGGPVTVVKNTGRRLLAMGHNVSYWVTCEGKDRKKLSSMDLANIFDITWPRSWYRSPALKRSLLANNASIDIININGFWTYPVYAASRVARANNTHYIIRPAGTLEPWALKYSGLKWLKKKTYFNLVSKPIIQNAACLHAVSLQEAEHFRQVGFQGSITIIPNGVDINEFTSGDSSEAEAYWPNLKNRPVVLFMSRLSRVKGLDILIPVWADLVKSSAYKDSMLVIAGPDDRGYRKVVEGIIDRCDVGSKVLLTGMVRGREKLAILRRADIFILPSYSENFGIVVPEALACGTPVITTTGTPWKEIQTVDAGRFVLPRDSELGQAIRELLDMSESQRNAMGQRGRNLVKKNYDWNTIVGKLLTVYNCILSGTAVPLHPEPLVDTAYSGARL